FPIDPGGLPVRRDTWAHVGSRCHQLGLAGSIENMVSHLSGIAARRAWGSITTMSISRVANGFGPCPGTKRVARLSWALALKDNRYAPSTNGQVTSIAKCVLAGVSRDRVCV